MTRNTRLKRALAPFIEAGRLRAAGRRAPVNDSWIAATAIAHGVPVVTQDSDYDAMPDVRVIKI